MRRRIASLALVLCTSACYRNVALTRVALVPGTQVTATLTPSGSAAMGNAIGPATTEVEGVVASVNGPTVQLYMLRVQDRNKLSTRWNRELVSFPSDALADLYERRLDKPRSFLAAGAVAVGAIIAGRHFGLGGGGGQRDPTTPAGR